MNEALDRRFLAAAIRLGAEGLGTTWPNPSVGALVVRDGVVIGRGRTAPGGRPHGEVVALAMAGEAAQGATLYVSLEPCAHHGRAPPCADAVIAAGIARVVAAIGDPDPRTKGAGFARLAAAGVAVADGFLAEQGARAHEGHLRRVLERLPHVLLKLAVSADDAIGRRGEGQVAVTGPIARRHAQALRSRFDAILVGRGTVEADDPALTCRLPGLEARSPLRVILDSRGALAGGLKVLNDGGRTFIFTAERESGTTGPVRFIVACQDAAGWIDLAACLAQLAEEGVTRLLVEGGARVARSFLEADLADEIMLFRGPDALGGGAVPALAGLPLSQIERSERYLRVERRMLGPDRMSRYERAR